MWNGHTFCNTPVRTWCDVIFSCFTELHGIILIFQQCEESCASTVKYVGKLDWILLLHNSWMLEESRLTDWKIILFVWIDMLCN